MKKLTLAGIAKHIGDSSINLGNSRILQIKKSQMKYITRSFSVLLACIITSCSYSDRVSYERSNRPATSPESIEVYDSGNLSRPYKVIGIVGSESLSMQSALDLMREEAAQLGADALLDFGPNGGQSGVTMLQNRIPGGSSRNTGFSAKAIVWETNNSSGNNSETRGTRSSDCLSALPAKFRNGVIDMTSDYGSPDPQTWYVTAKSPNNGSGLRYLEIREGRIVSNTGFSFITSIFWSHKPMALPRDMIDSRKVYEIAKQNAFSNGYSVSHALFALKNQGKSPEPVWTVWCYGLNDTYLGLIEVRAADGAILSVKGFK